MQLHHHLLTCFSNIVFRIRCFIRTGWFTCSIWRRRFIYVIDRDIVILFSWLSSSELLWMHSEFLFEFFFLCLCESGIFINFKFPQCKLLLCGFCLGNRGVLFDFSSFEYFIFVYSSFWNKLLHLFSNIFMLQNLHNGRSLIRILSKKRCHNLLKFFWIHHWNTFWYLSHYFIDQP